MAPNIRKNAFSLENVKALGEASMAIAGVAGFIDQRKKEEKMARGHAEDIVRAAHIGFRICENTKTSKSLLEGCEEAVKVSREGLGESMGAAFKSALALEKKGGED